jgi:hypothetical protein
MRRLVFALIAVAALALPIYAQSGATVANIPFAFIAGGTTLPAGEYVFHTSPTQFPASVTGPDRHTRFVPAWPSGVISGDPNVVFNRYGDQYFLSEVRLGAGSVVFPASRTELELRKTAAAPRREWVVLAMR